MGETDGIRVVLLVSFGLRFAFIRLSYSRDCSPREADSRSLARAVLYMSALNVRLRT